MEGQEPAILSGSEVLDLIDPVDPDALVRRKGGGWTAKWFQPVGLQVELLSTIEGVELLGEPYIIAMPSGHDMTAVDFVLRAQEVKAFNERQ